MGKGDWRRPATVDGETLRSNYERAFGKTETAEPRRVRAVEGGAIIPLERFHLLGYRDMPEPGQVVKWSGMQAVVKAVDNAEREVHVEWA